MAGSIDHLATWNTKRTLHQLSHAFKPLLCKHEIVFISDYGYYKDISI